MQAYLRVVAGPDAGRNIELTEGATLTIGRAEKSDTHLHDLGVSRLHCELRWEGGKFNLVDMDSVSGTLVDGQRITEHDLKHGEEFQVGVTRFKLYAAGIGAAQPAAAEQKSARELKPDEAVLTGKTISHYELGAPLAKDHTGTIYKARDIRDGKEVAFKVLHSDFASDDDDVKRFARAMTTARELHHPNLVALYSAGKQGNTCWFAMEYLEGEALGKVLERRGGKLVDWRLALAMGVQIARALEAAHAKHVVHGHVSPESILIRAKDKVAKLGDMMLAKVFERIKTTTTDRPGDLVGDVAYMPPERLKSDVEPDIRTDIYGLGATLYALLTGHPPFQGKTPAEITAQLRQADPVPPKKFQDSIPDKFQDAVMTMLAKRPELRFQSSAQAARALEQVAKAHGLAV
jgi:serine/threonine-protein kinase